MADNQNLAELMQEIKAASDRIAEGDAEATKRLEQLTLKMTATDGKLGEVKTALSHSDKKLDTLEASINDLWKRTGRPGGEAPPSEKELKARDDALDLLQIKHETRIGKKDPDHPFNPSEEQIKEAVLYRKALNAAMNCTDAKTLPVEYQKSLSAFTFGTNSWLLTPEQSNRVIRCIVDPTDLTGLFDSMNISAPSVKFPIDNERMALAAWACEAACFANNPLPDLQAGLGELEIKPETLRYIVCTSRDLLEDASVNVENWIMQRVSNGFRATINAAILLGDGVGKPLGILNPNAGIPVCETSPVTQAGQFTWQDLVMLKFEVPMEWQNGASYLMNQRTFALLLTMSDSAQRPIWGQLPSGLPGFTLAGSPINIVTQMPDVGPGATPIAFGNWRQVYLIVWRRAVTMQMDPYSAGWCSLYKFDARVGGGIICPNAARLLRIR